MIITVTPNPGLDLTYSLPATGSEDADVCRASRSTLEASGKGVNVSRALNAVGVPTCAVLPAGGPTGRCLVELLDDEHVPHRVVPQEGHTRVNTTALRPGGETLKLNGPGGTLTAAEQEALVGATRRALDDAAAGGGETWVAVCGSLPPGVTAHVVTELVDLAHAHGARCAVDASGEALVAALEARADLVAPNRDELAEVIDGGLRGGEPARGGPGRAVLVGGDHLAAAHQPGCGRGAVCRWAASAPWDGCSADTGQHRGCRRCAARGLAVHRRRPPIQARDGSAVGQVGLPLGHHRGQPARPPRLRSRHCQRPGLGLSRPDHPQVHHPLRRSYVTGDIIGRTTRTLIVPPSQEHPPRAGGGHTTGKGEAT